VADWEAGVMLINPYAFGGGPWTPSAITTALWLDASDSATVTTVSGTVSQWNDKSGNGRNATQGTAGNRPTYTTAGQNGLNVITFDGQNDWLALPNTTSPSGANAVFAACKPTHAFTANTSIIGRSYYWGSWYLSSTVSGTAVRFNIGRDGIDESQVNLSGLTNNTNKIFSATYNNANVSVSVNGGSFASTAYTSNLVYNANDATAIGTARTTSNVIAGPFNGPMYEIIVLFYMPNQTIIDKMQGYLAWKWGLVSNLPAGHPYKSAAPTV
jgi:hypothetical protein